RLLDSTAHKADRDGEVVEGANLADAHGARRRRLRIDIVEVLEARWILDVVEQRQAVAPLRRLRKRSPDKRKPIKGGGYGGQQASVKQEAAAQAHGGLQKDWRTSTFCSRTTFFRHTSSGISLSDIMSVFGKIATGSLAGMAAVIHIRVDPQSVRIPLNSLKNRPFEGAMALIDDA